MCPPIQKHCVLNTVRSSLAISSCDRKLKEISRNSHWIEFNTLFDLKVKRRKIFQPPLSMNGRTWGDFNDREKWEIATSGKVGFWPGIKFSKICHLNLALSCWFLISTVTEWALVILDIEINLLKIFSFSVNRNNAKKPETKLKSKTLTNV